MYLVTTGVAEVGRGEERVRAVRARWARAGGGGVDKLHYLERDRCHFVLSS